MRYRYPSHLCLLLRLLVYDQQSTRTDMGNVNTTEVPTRPGFRLLKITHFVGIEEVLMPQPQPEPQAEEADLQPELQADQRESAKALSQADQREPAEAQPQADQRESAEALPQADQQTAEALPDPQYVSQKPQSVTDLQTETVDKHIVNVPHSQPLRTTTKTAKQTLEAYEAHLQELANQPGGESPFYTSNSPRRYHIYNCILLSSR